MKWKKSEEKGVVTPVRRERLRLSHALPHIAGADQVVVAHL